MIIRTRNLHTSSLTKNLHASSLIHVDLDTETTQCFYSEYTCRLSIY